MQSYGKPLNKSLPPKLQWTLCIFVSVTPQSATEWAVCHVPPSHRLYEQLLPVKSKDSVCLNILGHVKGRFTPLTSSPKNNWHGLEKMVCMPKKAVRQQGQILLRKWHSLILAKPKFNKSCPLTIKLPIQQVKLSIHVVNKWILFFFGSAQMTKLFKTQDVTNFFLLCIPFMLETCKYVLLCKPSQSYKFMYMHYVQRLNWKLVTTI